MNTLMKFEKGSNVLQFEAGGDYPARRYYEKMQIQDRTAAGVMQVEELGIDIRRRVIDFNSMSINDYNSLVDWFLNVANGVFNSFTFIDEYGFSGSVKFLDNIIDFQEVSYQRFSGSITLEYQ